jgi:mannose/fructose/N-acetylgalactosamine-specific phosphotransferase system component IIC
VVSYVVISGILSGLFNLDTTAVAQTMLSRPIVISPLIGIILGGIFCEDVVYGSKVGIIIGVLLEFFWINVLSLGPSVPPNPSISSSVATAVVLGTSCLFQQQIQLEPYLIMMGIMYGICCGYIGGKIDMWDRWVNSKLMQRSISLVEQGQLHIVSRLTWKGVGIYFFVVVVVCMGLVLSGIYLFQVVINILPDRLLYALGNTLWIFLLICMGITLEMFMTKRNIIYFVIIWLIGVIVINRIA